MTLSEQLAAHSVGDHEFGSELVARTRLLLFDYLAIAAAGATKDSGIAAARAITSWSESEGIGASRLEGAERRALPSDAALVNGIAAHSLELDDTHEQSSSHPGVAIWPALLALADEKRCTMRELLEAAVVGYDVMCSSGILLGAADSYGRGFHPTGVAGIIGAAAACSRLLGLDSSRTTHAIGLAADMASGSLEFLSDGSWTKRLNAGAAASGGVRAALLAQAGFTAPRKSLEGRDGWLVQYGRGPSSDRILGLALGGGVGSTSIKLYPCCRYMHGVMDLMLDLHRDHPRTQPEDVESIDVAVIEAGQALVSNPPERKLSVATSVDAQFNMPFGAALAFVNGAATLDDFDHASDVATTLAPWLPKVRSVTDERVEAAYPATWQAAVTLTFKDGTVDARRLNAFHGSPGDPAEWDDILQKAVVLIGPQPAEILATSILQAAGDQPATDALYRPLATTY